MALDKKTQETIREEALNLSREFALLDGRRPRVLLMQTESDLAKDSEARRLAANAFADSGWDVDVSPVQSPEDSARSASDNDVHFVFYTSGSEKAVKNTVDLIRALSVNGSDDILIAVHQIIPKLRESLFRYGIICAFGPDHDFAQASLTMLRILIAREKADEEQESSY